MEKIRYRNLVFLGFPKYRVGVDGSVWSFRKGRWKLLKRKPHNSGYIRVTLHNDEIDLPILVHRLVLLAFVGPCPEGHEARHFPDATRTNNQLTNLSWATLKENQADRLIQGGHSRGERSGKAKFTNKQVRGLRTRFKKWGLSRRAFARKYAIKYQVSPMTIIGILQNNQRYADA